MKNDENLNIHIYRPFGPAIAQTTIPKILIDKINSFVDEVIKDEKKIKRTRLGTKISWPSYSRNSFTQ